MQLSIFNTAQPAQSETALTVLSFGGGQDSTAILYKLLFDLDYRKQYAPGKLIVVIADTGNEHDATVQHIKFVQDLCRAHQVEFYFIDSNSDYYTGDWRGGLINYYEAGNRIGSKAYPKTCTDKLKIQPIYKFLDGWIYKNYPEVKEALKPTLVAKIEANPGKEFEILKKAGLKTFAGIHGKIDILLGIAKGEEKRASTNEESAHVWQRVAINKVYPLLEEGLDRQACQDYIASTGHEVPPPSNCIICPFLSEQELLYLYRFNRPWFNKFVALEAAKIKHWEDKVDPAKNLGVWGNKLLPEKLEEAQAKYGHWTDAELQEYKNSHGHCVNSKY